MAEFKYRAVDDHGRQVLGKLDAESAEDVVVHLERQGLQVTAVQAVEPEPRPSAHGAPLSLDDLGLFNEQLLAIVRSGLPLGPSLRILAQDVRGRRLKRVVDNLQAELEKGATLSDALARQGNAFSPVYLSLIRAGERAGNLAYVLEVLGSHASRAVTVRHRIQEAMAYPLLVIFAAGSLLLFFLVRVVPSFGDIFKDFGARLPGLTLLVIGLSRHVTASLGALALLAAAIAGLVLLLKSTPGGQRFLHHLRGMVPVFGPLFREMSMARFAKSLAMLLQGRVAAPDSLRLAGAASGSAVLEQAAREAADRVEAGRRISDALEETGRFPHAFCWHLRTGEERSDVAPVLTSLAEGYERSCDRRTSHVAIVVTPLLTLAAAVLIGILIISVYLPIFSLADQISGG